MRKTLIGLSLLGVSSIFSFYKMSDGHLFIEEYQNASNINKYVEIPEEKLSENFKKLSRVYCYDENLRYFLLYRPYLGQSEDLLPIFKQHKFDPQWWESKFNFICLPSNENVPLYLRFYEPGPISIPQLQDAIKKYEADKNQEYFFGGLDPNRSKRRFYSKSDIRVMNYKSHVSLSRRNKKAEEIDFQAVLLNYMKSQKQNEDEQLSKYIPYLVRDVQESRIDKNDNSTINYISKIIKAIKMSYTQGQIDLLENSKILVIWNLPPKKYTNKDYVEDWNKRHPDHLKQVESKTINSIITGFAVDKRDNMTYNWIIDLGQDISVLLDYADENNILAPTTTKKRKTII